MSIFTQYWPIFLTIAAGVAAVSKFYLDWLKIRELQYKLSDLKEKSNQSESPIHTPTNEEIEKYGRPYSRVAPAASAILSVAFVAVISTSFLFYQYDLEKSSSNQHDTIRIDTLKSPNLNFMAIGTTQGVKYWSASGHEKFEGLIQQSGATLVVGKEKPKLLEFNHISGNHFHALFLFKELGIKFRVKYLLIRGPDKFWFVISEMESSNVRA